MKLAELEPALLKIIDERSWRSKEVLFEEADGVMFLCPVCFVTNSGPVGTHRIICWRPRVPLTVHPGPGRWEFVGSSLADLSLVAGSSSVLLTSGCRAHFFVKLGEIC